MQERIPISIYCHFKQKELQMQINKQSNLYEQIIKFLGNPDIVITFDDKNYCSRSDNFLVLQKRFNFNRRDNIKFQVYSIVEILKVYNAHKPIKIINQDNPIQGKNTNSINQILNPSPQNPQNLQRQVVSPQQENSKQKKIKIITNRNRRLYRRENQSGISSNSRKNLSQSRCTSKRSRKETQQSIDHLFQEVKEIKNEMAATYQLIQQRQYSFVQPQVKNDPLKCFQCKQQLLSDNFIKLKCTHIFDQKCFYEICSQQLESNCTTLMCICKQDIKLQNIVNQFSSKFTIDTYRVWLFKNQIEKIKTQNSARIKQCSDCDYFCFNTKKNIQHFYCEICDKFN